MVMFQRNTFIFIKLACVNLSNIIGEAACHYYTNLDFAPFLIAHLFEVVLKTV